MPASPYDILFEPVKIGPVTAPNRFYQVPHCTGLGHLRPKALAEMRGIKAEGGWGVICTEEVEIHPSGDIGPYVEGRIWDDADIPALALMTDAVHKHGSLAGIELVHNGKHSPNHLSRLAPLGPSSGPVDSIDPVHARAMDLNDIADMRRWYREAAIRARTAGFDIIYIYAGHDMSLLSHFMVHRHNQRTDHYGGSLENRIRLTKEIIEDVKDAVGDTCAIAFRFAVDEGLGKNGLTSDGEGRDIVESLANLPDLWDVNISDWSNDSATARFEPNEGYQDEFTSFVNSITQKPVVGVGRYTSPDGMVKRIKSGMLDFIGAARPSIADPFLPTKIREGRIDEIRECIGCNICVSGDNLCVPMRCTQNPTISEEWRRSWHPERIAHRHADETVLVIGAGPSGLECALQLANRGYQVTLAEKTKELGGRILGESALPGLQSYIRVRDYRQTLLRRMANVSIYLESEMTPESVREVGADHVFIATGSTWKRDGTGRSNCSPLEGLDQLPVFTPDDIMAGITPTGHVTLFDDDHYYMAGVLAEKLIKEGCTVTYVSPATKISAWTDYTLEQEKIQKRLLDLGMQTCLTKTLKSSSANAVQLSCIYTGAINEIETNALVLVTSRAPNNRLANELGANNRQPDPAKKNTIQVIGDALTPSTIAAATHNGHLAARMLGEINSWDHEAFRRELPG